jgi:glutathione S-transferase
MRRILWGRATSSNVMKVIWTLEELQLPYERIDVGGSFGKTDTPEYRAMNPTGLVPTLQEDDFTLWESNAICRYLCHAHAPHSKLWPQDPRVRANIDRWMDAQQTCLNRSISVIFWNLVRTPPDKRDTAAVGQAVPEAARVWGMVSAELAEHPYLAGNDLTLADVPWGPHLHRWFNMEFDRPEIPHLRAWYDRLLQRPAYKQHLAGPVV